MRVHVVDGTYELFRAFFGAPAATARGKEVGATRGILRSLASWLRTGEVTHCGVAFDHVIESFRNDLFDGYKTGAGLEPALVDQFEPAERAAAALGLRVWSMIEFEADDALATCAAALRDDRQVEQIVIASPDKDLAQCVRGAKVVMLDRLRQTTLDEPGVHAKFGIGPASIPDWLALVGDDADGIPGVPRWGARSAATVLARWIHVEDIPADARAWDVKVRGADALAASLAEHRGVVGLYKTLATLREDAPIACTLPDLEWRGVDAPALAALCDELEIDESSLGLKAR